MNLKGPEKYKDTGRVGVSAKLPKKQGLFYLSPEKKKSFIFLNPNISPNQALKQYQEKVKEGYNKQKNTIKAEIQGKLKEKRNAMAISRTEVNEKNIQEVSRKLRKFIANDEGIEDNLVLEVGDRIIWNARSKSLSVISADGTIGEKFAIRFTPETKEEYKNNSQLAKNMQDQAEKDAISGVEQGRESLQRGGKTLGDWIVRRGAWRGAKNSCGASVGSLLNQFGFRKILPQSGRDGKNWDTIIEKYASGYFTKIPVSHPKDAPAGSIIVFNEGPGRTKTRRRCGHVEIKGSNGKFYHYLASAYPGGSTVSNARGQAYRRATGFTGYAYVYNGKKPPR